MPLTVEKEEVQDKLLPAILTPPVLLSTSPTAGADFLSMPSPYWTGCYQEEVSISIGVNTLRFNHSVGISALYFAHELLYMSHLCKFDKFGIRPIPRSPSA